ncbi:zinc-dependent peptidase, partial [Staphylococcus aureus]|uniref:zinc-dependent peptidase n=2 Tax=Bacteria TaxID=2 RepID=UPI0018FF0AFD
MIGILERFRRWRRARRLDAVTVTDEMWERAEARLPFLDYLEADHRRRLRELARAFIAEKQFYGAHGFALTDEVIVTIALQACLPVLRIGLRAYRGWVG